MSEIIDSDENAEQPVDPEPPAPAAPQEPEAGEGLQGPELALVLALIGIAAAGFWILYRPLIEMTAQSFFGRG